MWAFATVGLQPDDNFMENMARAALEQLNKFVPQGLSNLAWAFATITADHKYITNSPGVHVLNLFDGIAETSVRRLEKFNSQALANMAWAFAKIRSLSESEIVRHKATSTLFREIAAASIPLMEQNKFNTQNLANMAWAFAKTSQNNPELFETIAKTSVSQLDKFTPQEVANLSWAFATITADQNDGTDSPGVHVFDLFDGIAETSVHRMDKFTSQDLANMAWAFAKMHSLSASEKVRHKATSTLFREIAAASTPLLEQNKFNSQGLANLAWAFATMSENNQELLETIAKASLLQLDNFNPQHVANLSWAFATIAATSGDGRNGDCKAELFDAIDKTSPSIFQREKFTSQSFGNLVWAFAVNGHGAPTLSKDVLGMGENKMVIPFDDLIPQGLANLAWSFAVFDDPIFYQKDFHSDLRDACMSGAYEFSDADLRQLHQWQLWCQEVNKAGFDVKQVMLPSNLRKRCYDAFTKEEGHPSRLQKDVVETLTSLGLQPREEVRTEMGYSLDAVVTHKGQKVGVEVDGPSHFIGQSPTGATNLKRRQLCRLEGWNLVSVPYWEWNELSSREISPGSRGLRLLERLEEALGS